jgi:phage protein D
MSISTPLRFVSWLPNNAYNPTDYQQDLSDRVISLNFIDNSKKSDECKISMFNGDLSLLSDPRLAKGNKLQVTWGYFNNMSQTKIVTIKKVTGWSKLNIDCVYSEELDFINEQRTRSWENVTAIEVAEEIANEMGYRNAQQKMIDESDLSIRQEGISQMGETDYAFLSRISREEDYIFLIRDGVFHFHPPRLDVQPTIVLTYFDSDRGDFIGEPNLEEGTLGIPVSVTRRGHSNAERSSVEGSANNSTDRNRPVLGGTIVETDRTQDRLVTRQVTQSDIDRYNAQTRSGATSDTTNEDAESRARRNFRRAERETIKLSAKIIGNPNINADETLEIQGLPEKMNGNYYVEQNEHEIGSSGYICKLKLKRNATNRSNSGRMSGQARQRERTQQLQARMNLLNQRVADGNISPQQFQTELTTLLSSQVTVDRETGNNSQGRVNNQHAPSSDEMEQVTTIDPETGRRQTRYRRRPQQTNNSNPDNRRRN